MCRRLRKVLTGNKFLQLQRSGRIQMSGEYVSFLLLFIIGIDAAVAVEQLPGRRNMKEEIAGFATR